MTNDEKLKFAQFISRYAHHSYEWGRHDCMLFPVNWHDARYGSTKTASIQHKYSNRIQAIKFYKNFISVTGWLAGNGYNEVQDLQDGDYVVSGIAQWPQVYVALGGVLYMMCEDGLRGFSPGAIDIKSIWRR
jgi:hypothetical protein